MSIQYAGGTNVNTTFTCTVGTRREIVDGLVAALTSAGWSTISGGGTGDVRMQSATTPQNLQIQVRVYDPGAGNCAQVFMRNQAGTKVSIATYLLPAVGKVYRVVADKYQFFIFTPGTSVCREFVACGVPYLPSFLVGVITGDCGWLVGNAISDTDVVGQACLRASSGVPMGALWNRNRYSGLVNNSLIDVGINSSYPSDFRLTVVGGAETAEYTSGQLWHDDSIVVCEPLVAWGLAATADNAKIRGQMWDAIVVGASYGPDSTISFDGKSWWALTANNGGSTSSMRGTLFLMVP